ncbi:biotin/lipoyl-binding protein, partial [Salmonella enterica subsp. enterica serovar Montevideo]|nr:biotin/lipoyl-binding protein [Salmonella enterica subsp. enterica serovar Montevideo]
LAQNDFSGEQPYSSDCVVLAGNAVIPTIDAACRIAKAQGVPLPVAKAEKSAASGVYTVEVEGKAFVVKVSDGGDISQLTAAVPVASSAPVQAAAPAGAGTPVTAPLAGNIWKVIATEGQTVAEGDVLLILEAMKMETEIRAAQAGTVRGIAVKSGDAVSVGDTLMTLA